MTSPSLTQTTHKYLTENGDSTILNTIDVWTFAPVANTQDASQVWLIYIHGGAWRDPETDSSSFNAGVQTIAHSALRSKIAGFASINYRLSPYPSHPRSPSSPDDPSRNVQHPTHIRDVEQALLYLDERFQISNRYLLAGHSAGAALSFQVQSSGSTSPLPRPLCVLGISGIYQLGAFVENHKEISAYREIVERAFPNEAEWDEASPATTQATGALWKDAKLVVISHSKTDGLVEDAQSECMLERARSLAQIKDKVHFIQATGAHDEVWESGTILAGLITKSLEILDASF